MQGFYTHVLALRKWPGTGSNWAALTQWMGVSSHPPTLTTVLVSGSRNVAEGTAEIRQEPSATEKQKQPKRTQTQI